MIPFKQAHKLVLDSTLDFGTESISLKECAGRILAEDIVADRDFPPFDRDTKDGIAIHFETYEKGQRNFKIQEIAAAGNPQKSLNNPADCIEVMTGAMLPRGTDTVIMYEELEFENGIATIKSEVNKGQNIHYQGIDQNKGNILLESNCILTLATIGLLATVGKVKVKVKKLPKVAIISTGNELVPNDQNPEPHQIRSSNSISLQALLDGLKIKSEIYHIPDERFTIKNKLEELISQYDILMLSGGVSMGKFDFLPEVFEEIGIEKIFHKVAQRPGKPFWFGQDLDSNTTIFSFPGNPNSTFVNFHIYFKDWLSKCLDQEIKNEFINLNHDLDNSGSLTRFPLVIAKTTKGHSTAELIKTSGSGDLVSLSKASGVVEIPSGSSINKGKQLRFIRF